MSVGTNPYVYLWAPTHWKHQLPNLILWAPTHWKHQLSNLILCAPTHRKHQLPNFWICFHLLNVTTTTDDGLLKLLKSAYKSVFIISS